MKFYLHILAVAGLSITFTCCTKQTDRFEPLPDTSQPTKTATQVAGGEDDDIPILTLLKGKLVDPNNDPIANASVSLSGHPVYTYATTTDGFGGFDIPAVKRVNYNLIFSAPGFQQEVYSINLETVPDPYDWGTHTMQWE